MEEERIRFNQFPSSLIGGLLPVGLLTMAAGRTILQFLAANWNLSLFSVAVS